MGQVAPVGNQVMDCNPMLQNLCNERETPTATLPSLYNMCNTHIITIYYEMDIHLNIDSKTEAGFDANNIFLAYFERAVSSS